MVGPEAKRSMFIETKQNETCDGTQNVSSCFGVQEERRRSALGHTGATALPGLGAVFPYEAAEAETTRETQKGIKLLQLLWFKYQYNYLSFGKAWDNHATNII